MITEDENVSPLCVKKIKNKKNHYWRYLYSKRGLNYHDARSQQFNVLEMYIDLWALATTQLSQEVLYTQGHPSHIGLKGLSCCEPVESSI